MENKAFKAYGKAGKVFACSNPDNEWYWGAWENILNNSFFVDEYGNKYELWQDDDLWIYCYDLMTDEEKQDMGFEV